MEVVSLKSLYEATDKNQEWAQPPIGHFNMFQIEDLSPNQGNHVNYSRRDFYKITFVRAHGCIHYADRSVKVKGSVLIFTNPTIPFFWENYGANRSGFACVFTEAFFNRYESIKDCLMFQNVDNGILVLSSEQVLKFQEMFAKMYLELQEDYEFKYDLLRNLLMEVVHSAQKLQPALSKTVSSTNASERIARLFKELLERQFPIELTSQKIRLRSASDFAAALNVHVNHLNKALKTTMGDTTIQLINARVLQEAQILLKGTTWSISEIAWCLGFEEANHFSTFFKNRSGLTPNQFRKLK